MIRSSAYACAAALLLAPPVALPFAPPPTAAAAPAGDNPYPALRIMDQRLAEIDYRLTRENAAWCRDARPDNGMRAANRPSFPEKRWPRVVAAYDVDPDAKNAFVIAVVPGSAAERLGVRVGQDAAGIAWAAVEEAPHCAAQMMVKASDEYYAATDGRTIQISAALIARTRDDDELAALVAHELAHIVLDHPARLKGRRSIARVKATERDADRLSVWLMARAGYDPQAAVRFWTHYGPTRDKGIFNAPTHENWKERVRRLTSEITAMQAARTLDRDAMPIISGLRKHR